MYFISRNKYCKGYNGLCNYIMHGINRYNNILINALSYQISNFQFYLTRILKIFVAKNSNYTLSLPLCKTKLHISSNDKFKLLKDLSTIYIKKNDTRWATSFQNAFKLSCELTHLCEWESFSIALQITQCVKKLGGIRVFLNYLFNLC